MSMILVGSPFFYITLLSGGILWFLRKRYRSTAFKVAAINIVSILFLLSLFDSVAVKMFSKVDSFRVPDSRFHHGLKPFVNEITAWDKDGKFKYTIKTNSLGFVDGSTRIVDKKKNGKRIMLIGDSFIEGVGYKWEDTVAGMLSEKLKKDGVEVLNASVASYSPKLYWLKTEYFLNMGLEIDDLYVFVDVSDIIDEVVYDYFVPETFSKFRQDLEPVIDFFSKNSFVFRNYRIKHVLNQKNPYQEDSVFWGGLKNFYLLKPKWIYNEGAYEMYGRKGLGLAKKHMDNIYKLCKKRGIRLHIGVWPWYINLTEKHERKHLEIWKKFASDRKIDFIQFYDIFEAIPVEAVGDYFIPEDIHWSKEGNFIVAEKLYEHINSLKGEKK